MKSDIYKAIMSECSQVAAVLLDNYLHENLDTGEITFDEDCEMCYVVNDLFGELGGEVFSIIERAIEEGEEQK